MTEKPAASDCDHPQYPEYADRFGEDPARILYHIDDPQPRIRGLESVALVRAYLDVETAREGPRGEAVAREIERVADDSGGPVDLITHSMGGLDARWAIKKVGAADYVDDLVTLGSPHQGTYVSYVGLVTAGGRDMIPRSTMMDELNDDGLADGVEYTAVWSHIDELIVPSSYASIPEYMFQDAAGRNVNSGYQEHVQLVVDRHVFDQYVQYLD